MKPIRPPAFVGLIAGVAVLVLPNCARRVADYSFEARGTVTNEAGSPIPNVRVTLEVGIPVYQVITPVTRTDTYTDTDGNFSFWFISHDPDPPYALWFDKEGYESVSVEDARRAMNPHLIRLKPFTG